MKTVRQSRKAITALTFAGALAAAALASPAARAATVLFDDFETASHPGGSRTAAGGQAQPIFSRFDSTATTATIGNDATLGSNALLVSDIDALTSTSGAILIPLNSTFSLANTGDTATLSFKFRYTNQGTAGGNSFRFGLENSTGSTVTGDNQAASDNDTGYYAAIGSGGTAPATNSIFFDESGGTVPILGGVDRTNVAASSATGTGLNDTASHTASLTLTRTASGVLISLSLDGAAAITGTDTTAPLRTSFDEVAFSGGFGSSGQAFAIDDLTVTASNVPEPTVLAALALAGVPVLARRRKA